MDWDEPTGKKKPQPKDLAPMGAVELTEYIGELKAEIIRAEAEIAKRDKTKNAAEAFFRKN